MIATVHFDLIDGPHAATLDDAGRWSCPTAPVVESVLRMLFGLEDHGPADGDAGHRQANEAADYLEGTATFEPKRPHPEGTVS